MNKGDLETYIAGSQPNICQICVLKDGQEIYELRFRLLRNRLAGR